MTSKTSKRQLIWDYAKAHRLERAGAAEIGAIEHEFRRQLGPADRTSPSYIANVLRQVGIRVEYDDRYVDPWMEEPYASRLNGLLEFRNLERAQASLQRLDAVYREYRENTDRVGTSLVRQLVIKGKQRAESLAASPRVSPQKRQEKEEIAQWFRVWLEIPDLFFDWLELRQRSEEFQMKFSSLVGQNGKKKPDSLAA